MNERDSSNKHSFLVCITQERLPAVWTASLRHSSIQTILMKACQIVPYDALNVYYYCEKYWAYGLTWYARAIYYPLLRFECKITNHFVCACDCKKNSSSSSFKSTSMLQASNMIWLKGKYSFVFLHEHKENSKEESFIKLVHDWIDFHTTKFAIWCSIQPLLISATTS